MVSWSDFLFSEKHGFWGKNAECINKADDYDVFRNPDQSIVQIWKCGKVVYMSSDYSEEGIIYSDGSATYNNSKEKREGYYFKDGSGYFLETDGKVYKMKNNGHYDTFDGTSGFINSNIEFFTNECRTAEEKGFNEDLMGSYLTSLIQKSIDQYLEQKKEEDEKNRAKIREDAAKERDEERWQQRQQSSLRHMQAEHQKKEDEKRKEKLYKKEKRRKFVKKHFGAIMVAVLFCVACLIIFVDHIRSLDDIPIGYGADSFIGMNTEAVIESISQQGFSNIEMEPIEDLMFENSEFENQVIDVSFGRNTSYSAENKADPKISITIRYHAMQKLSVPLGSKDIKGKNYQEVIEKFNEAGFQNVVSQAAGDIITGWINDENEVKEITIDGENSFKQGEMFRCNANIVVVYHSRD